MVPFTSPPALGTLPVGVSAHYSVPKARGRFGRNWKMWRRMESGGAWNGDPGEIFGAGGLETLVHL